MISIPDMQAFEREVADAFNSGRIKAPIHLSSNFGQVHEYFNAYWKDGDWVATNWRSHLHCLAGGVPRNELMQAILAGKSITLCFPEYKVISSAIVGGIIPIAIGIAWAIKHKGGTEKVHVFMGDMTARTGIKYECAQYAEGHDLPISFISENNGISVCTPTVEVWGVGDGGVIKRARTYEYCKKLDWPHSGAGKRVEF